MSIPKNGQFHKHQAYITRPDSKTVRLTNYQSVVADFIESPTNAKHMVVLYPRWEYSPTTIRQVTRFISECSGLWYNVEELRRLRRLGATSVAISGNCVFVFSNLFPRG